MFSSFFLLIAVESHCFVCVFITTSWNSIKQRSVTRSCTEVEYRAVAIVAAKLARVDSFLCELGVVLPRCWSHVRTYALIQFFTRPWNTLYRLPFCLYDKVAVGQPRIFHVSTNDQLFDAFTKPLSRQHLEFLWSKIGVFNNTTVLREHIRKAPLPTHIEKSIECNPMIQAAQISFHELQLIPWFRMHRVIILHELYWFIFELLCYLILWPNLCN